MDRPINLLGRDRQGLEALFERLGERRFRASQLLQWIHQFGVADVDAMTNLSKALRAELASIAEIRAPEIVVDRTSSDGTRKWLLRLDDGNHIEMVYIPEPDRGTLCVSSQVGCSLNCRFCSTGHQGYNRNLTTEEILGQLWQANRQLGGFPRAHVVTNVVLMGMGEPLLNLDAVAPALRVMVDHHGYHLSRRRVTVSTAGIVPGIDRLREVCEVALAVSLHAPNDALRDELVPLNRKYPLDALLSACRDYLAGRPHDRITFEYVMLAGVNDSPAHADELIARLRDVPSKVNLIPFNPFPGAAYGRSDAATIGRFRERLMAADITTITRRTRGEDIDAACGQLVGEFHDRTRRRAQLMVGAAV